MTVFSSNSQSFPRARNWVLMVCGLAVRLRAQIGVGERYPWVALPAGETLPCHSFQPWPSRVLRGRLASGLTHGGQEANENTLVSSSCWVVWKHWLLSIKHAGEDSGRRREGRLARVWDLRTSRRQGGINTLPQGAGTPAPTGGTEGRSHPGVSTETACRAQTSTSTCQKQSWVPFLWHLERN